MARIFLNVLLGLYVNTRNLWAQDVLDDLGLDLGVLARSRIELPIRGVRHTMLLGSLPVILPVSGQRYTLSPTATLYCLPPSRGSLGLTGPCRLVSHPYTKHILSTQEAVADLKALRVATIMLLSL